MSVLLRLVLMLASIVGTAQAFGVQDMFPRRSRARAYAYAVNAVNSRPLFATRQGSVLGKDEQMAEQVKVRARRSSEVSGHFHLTSLLLGQVALPLEVPIAKKVSADE